MDKVHLVSFSPCGGTAKVGRAILTKMDLPVTEIDWTKPENRTENLSFSSNDLVLFAFPVYGGRMPRNLEKLFENLQGDTTPCVLVAVYGNRAFEGALIDLDAAARSKGFKPVAAIAAVAEHSLAPQVASARPDNIDCDCLADYGCKIIELVGQGHSLEKAPGAYPEWEMPKDTYFFPITDDAKCISCGQCVKLCPTGAINQTSPSMTDIQSCIVCGACAKYCPQNARIMGNEQTRSRFQPHLATAVAQRKEAELYF